MSVREYIGARYVPLFADPIEWSSALAYEPITVVKYQGASYVSRKSVPVGIQIDNEDYWIRWADYNAQLEHYIDTVDGIQRDVDAIEETVDLLETSFDAKFDDNGKIESNLVIADSISNGAVTSAKIADGAVASAKIADSAVSTSKINSNAVTTEKINSNAVTTEKINSSAVTTAKIADGAVTAAKLASNVINTIVNKANNTQMLLIGDSWLDPTNTRNLKTYIPRKFNIPTSRVYNAAVGGTGFIRDYLQNFSDQADSLIANDNIDKNVPTIIIVIGGTNDYVYSTTYSDYVNAINSLATKLKNAFPNSVMQVFFMQARTDRNYPYQLITNVINNTTQCVVNNAAFPLSYEYFADVNHPTDGGCKLFANYVASCFGLGQFYTDPVSINIAPKINAIQANAVSIATVRISWTETGYQISYYIKVDNTIPANTLNAYLTDFENFMPIRGGGGNMCITQLYRLGGTESITITYDNNGTRMGIRNLAQIGAGTYIGSAFFNLA